MKSINKDALLNRTKSLNMIILMVIPMVKPMRVAKPRWGEVTIKKQGESKNKFDKTRSFSVEQTETNYSVEEYYEILKIATGLTSKTKFEELKRRLKQC